MPASAGVSEEFDPSSLSPILLARGSLGEHVSLQLPEDVCEFLSNDSVPSTVNYLLLIIKIHHPEYPPQTITWGFGVLGFWGFGFRV